MLSLLSRAVRIFLSTLSLRRATSCTSMGRPKRLYFYPRSPCGERQPAEHHANSQQEFLSTLSLRRATDVIAVMTDAQSISIHALLAESDPLQRNANCNCRSISIHALLAESDISARRGARESIDFYPRSPCGERPYF